DGIRDRTVTGVQTCALPILTVLLFHREPIPIIDSVKNPTAKHTFWAGVNQFKELLIAAIAINVNDSPDTVPPIIIYTLNAFLVEIGRASCREGVSWTRI